MEVMKSNGYVYGAKLTAAERKALDMEARRALAEHTRRYDLEIEAVVIRELRRATGWGEIRLKRFYDNIDTSIKSLIERYEAESVDAPWLCTAELKNEGLDIEKWHREKYPNEQYNVKYV